MAWNSTLCARFVSQEEERELLRRYADGDKVAQNRLVESQIRLLSLMASRLTITSPAAVNYEDLLQEGVLAVLQCLPKFDVESGYRLSTYTVTTARWCMYKLARQSLIRIPNIALSGDAERAAGISYCDMDSLSEESLFPGSPGYREPANMDILMSWVTLQLGSTALSLRDVQVLAAYAMGETLHAIGQRLGVTRERVRQIRNRALCRLREAVT